RRGRCPTLRGGTPVRPTGPPQGTELPQAAPVRRRFRAASPGMLLWRGCLYLLSSTRCRPAGYIGLQAPAVFAEQSGLPQRWRNTPAILYIPTEPCCPSAAEIHPRFGSFQKHRCFFHSTVESAPAAGG